MRSADSTVTHMTLSSPLPDSEPARAMQWLTAEFARRPAAQCLVLDQLVIARQAGGAFRVIRTAPLGA
jgi:hypothetical protein